MAKLYHYTKIDTLQAIVENKTIKFNRLDGVDDKEEFEFGSGPSDIKVSKYIFISSWTKESEEIPDLWEKYGDNYRGIRIAMDEPFLESMQLPSFPKYHFFSPDLSKYKDCFLPSLFNEAKLHEIQYVINNKERIKDLINNEEDLVKIKLKELGIYKNKEIWGKQKESRYRIVILPSPRNTYTSYIIANNMLNEVEEVIKLIFKDKIYVEPKEVYVPIKEKALKKMEVTMGKETTEDDKAKVKKLLRIQSGFFHKRRIFDSMLK